MWWPGNMGYEEIWGEVEGGDGSENGGVIVRKGMNLSDQNFSN